MIVVNTGYKKLKDLEELRKSGQTFSIYRTPKNTRVVILNCNRRTVSLFQPKYDRLPYKVTEGKSIIMGIQVWNSDNPGDIPMDGWNNGEQIMSYEEFDLTKHSY